MMIQPLFLGNWKMNLMSAEVRAFAAQFNELFSPNPSGKSDAGFAPAFTSIGAALEAFGSQSQVLIGAQNVHWLDSGAHTGEISAPMLKELGAKFVIIGHSERRQFYGETDGAVSKRAKTAISHGLTAVVCIGETKEQFEAGITANIVDAQLDGSLSGLTAAECANLVLAYEPVWAIGTGLAATPEIAAKVHLQIRRKLITLFGAAAGESLPILYGGSTTPKNVAELLSQKNINGALVGGASLKPDVFWELINNGRNA